MDYFYAQMKHNESIT